MPRWSQTVIRTLESAEPQPAWIAYMVPAERTRQFGCDSWWREGESRMGGGTVHLEPPAEVLILFRVDGNQVGRIRTLAPDCDIDAGGVPFLGWSRDGGDLRVAHFFATHAMHFIPAIGYVAARTLPGQIARRTVIAFSAAFVGFIAYASLEALQGKPFLTLLIG